MNRTIKLAVAIVAGVWLAPKVLDMVGVPAADGFGTDDLVTAGVILALIFVLDSVF